MQICWPKVVQCCPRAEGLRTTFDKWGSTNLHDDQGIRLNLFVILGFKMQQITVAVNLWKTFYAPNHFNASQSNILCNTVLKYNSTQRVQYFHHQKFSLEQPHIRIHILHWPTVSQKLKRNGHCSYIKWKTYKFIFNWYVLCFHCLKLLKKYKTHKSK